MQNGSPLKLPSIAETLRDLETGETSSCELVERCLRAIADPAGEGARTFLQVYADSARREAREADISRAAGHPQGPLAGIPVSIKDLFDVSGETTRAGSTVLANAPPASADATIVHRLEQAGAILIGRTNMTEFAYSGLGLNPHYGTPLNPYDRANGRIPGGSSSGAAVSVSDGMALAAIGTDTGGSVRIPAALCGLTGFKPTASRLPMDGLVPLAPSLDSVGPIAPTVDCCARLDAVLAGTPYHPLPSPPLSRLRLGLLQGYVLDDLDPPVTAAFERAIHLLGASGAVLEHVFFPALDRIPAGNQFAAVEAYAWHRHLLAHHADRYDPHVSARILLGAAVPEEEYRAMQRVRQEIIALAAAAFAPFDAILLPTTPCIAPPLATLQASDEAYFQANGRMLRNTSIFNYLDGCALSLPCHANGEPPTGLMLASTNGRDETILQAGSAVEVLLNRPT